MFYSFVFCALFIYILYQLVFTRLERRGIYPLGNLRTTFKQYLLYAIIRIRKWRSGGERGNAAAGYGVKSTCDVSKLERIQDLGSSPLAIDAVLFTGGSDDGTYVVLSAARRQNGIVQCIFVLYVPELGVLHHPINPDTTMIQKSGEFGWRVEGIDIQPVEPMRRWRLSYSGDMILRQSGEDSIPTIHHVELDAVYTSDLDYFDFDSDMEPMVIARAMSLEPWDREYFNRIRAAHQNHYEQFGKVSGTLRIDEDYREISVDVMRDHTHGSSRDWSLMHRYALHNFTTSSGLRGFLGVISQPGTFTSLELGYIYTPDKRKHPVQEVDLPLWRLGEGGQDPSDYGFRFKAGDKWYMVQVKVIERKEFMFGEDWEARVIERFCRYKINDEEAWGVSEWEYRHREGRS